MAIENYFDDDIELVPDEFTEDDEEDRRRLVYISVNKIYPHPDNPRKDIGDVTELAQSLIANGIMQNLTVVKNINDTRSYNRLLDGGIDGTKYSPAYMNHATKHAFEGSYTVIIGHRRLAAAKAAGMTEVPCVISDMDYKTQISTMMTENLQRVDLTIYEQAQCFKQMKLDLGMDMGQISEKTGFSETTIRRRLKLSDLDPGKLQKASHRQISMDDLEKISKIENVEERNKLLEDVGTYNFDYSYKRAIKAQEEEQLRRKWRTSLLSRGLTELGYRESTTNDNYRQSTRSYAICSSVSPDEYVLDDDQQYFSFNCSAVYFKRKKNASDDEKRLAYEREREKERLRKEALAEITKTAYELRREFVESISESAAMKFAPIAIEYNVRRDWCDVDNYGYSCNNYAKDKFPGRIHDGNGFTAVSPLVEKAPFRAFLVHTYLRWGDSEHLGYTNYNGDYTENKRLNYIYDFLRKLGYEMSDEEKELMSGTSPLYRKEWEENAV